MAAMQSSMDRKVTAQLEPINHPVADDFADKLAVVLSLDVDPVGHSVSLPDIVVWAGRLRKMMGFPHRGFI